MTVTRRPALAALSRDIQFIRYDALVETVETRVGDEFDEISDQHRIIQTELGTLSKCHV